MPAPPPPRKASIISSSFARGRQVVMSASAQLPTQAAVGGVSAAPTMRGARAGRLHRRASSTTTRPRWLTTSPRHSARITSTHSARRALRSDLGGQRSPVMASLMYWPVPSATQKRSGNISASVAAACAMMAGW